MTNSEDPQDGNKGKEMIYGLTADERGALLTGLAGLPDTMPPRAVWHRIREQAEAEGLFEQSPARRYASWYAGAGLAAAVALAVVMVPRFEREAPVEFPTVPDNAQVSNLAQTNVLEALMVESRELENDLRALPDQPRVVRAGTQATILELEDRIAAIDYQLSDPSVLMTDEDREIFWRERVRLMKSLVRLRYAQTQRTAF